MKSILVCLLGLSALAHGSTIISTGATTSGGVAVDATAVFTLSTNTVQIQFTNNIVDPTSVSQNINGINFTLSNGATVLSAVPTVSGFTGSAIDISGSGVPTAATAVALATIQANYLTSYLSGTKQEHLSALGSGNPDYTIIGKPGGNGHYNNDNGSLAGNPAHPPFLVNSPIFTLTIAGVTANTTVSNVQFLFGTSTASVNDVTFTSVVPEPATSALIGLGLGLLGMVRKRRSA